MSSLVAAQQSDSQRHALVASLLSYGPLHPDDVARIASLVGELTAYPAQKNLDGLGRAAAKACWCVARGWAGTVNLMTDGRRQIVDLLLPGDVVEAGELGRLELTLHAFTPILLQDVSELARHISAEPATRLHQAWRAM